MTLLEAFIQANGIDVAELLRLTKISDIHFARLRDGRTKAPRELMHQVADVISWLACRRVYVWELFEI